MLTRLTIAALLLAACPLFAEPPKAGDEAPNFKALGKLVNPPEFARELKDSKGEVILIYEWNARDGTKAGLTDIQAYQAKWGGLGLQVWTIHRLDYEKFAQIDVLARSEGWTFPICLGGFYDDANDFFAYKESKSFRNCVIGIDGKVAHYGKGDAWKVILDAELAKVVYPNLGKHTVAEDAEVAAKKFAKREFGKALTECERLLATELAADVKADLELISKRANELATARLDRVKAAKEDKRYDLAMKNLTLLDDEYGGHKISADAKLEVKALKKDKAIKKELDAYEDLEAVITKDGKGDALTYMNALLAFAKAKPGMRAAGVAESMAGKIKPDLD